MITLSIYFKLSVKSVLVEALTFNKAIEKKKVLQFVITMLNDVLTCQTRVDTRSFEFNQLIQLLEFDMKNNLFWQVGTEIY